VTAKPKSLISIYDNSTDGEQQINQNSLPLVGILGSNRRCQAFRKRLQLSGFPTVIQCDINSHQIDQTNYISFEQFLHQSPSIILITEYFQKNLDDFYSLPKQPLIIDVRQINFTTKSSHLLLSIPDCYQAFGNLSDWEIENGTDRARVSIEQLSPINLIRFIENLNCFSRGIEFIDQYTYNHKQTKPFHNCLFPFLLTTIVLCLSILFSLIEYRNHKTRTYFYRQASSIAASTSITLLSFLFLLRPLIEIVNFFYQKFRPHQHVLVHSKFLQNSLQSRHYLAWYSISFACIHLIFLAFTKNIFNDNIYFYPVLLGLIALVLLSILSFVFFPWISERLQWREYHLLTSHVGSFSLVFAFLHVFFHWKYDYYYYYYHNINEQKDLFQLKFLSIFLPIIVLLTRFILYGILRPIHKIAVNQPQKSREQKSISTVVP